MRLVFAQRACDLFRQGGDGSLCDRHCALIVSLTRKLAQAFDERFCFRLHLIACDGAETLLDSAGRRVESIHHTLINGDAPQSHAVEQALELVRQLGHSFKLDGRRRAFQRVNMTKDTSDQLAPRASFPVAHAQRLQIAEQNFKQVFGFGQELAQHMIVHKGIVNSEQ